MKKNGNGPDARHPPNSCVCGLPSPLISMPNATDITFDPSKKLTQDIHYHSKYKLSNYIRARISKYPEDTPKIHTSRDPEE